jgi:hypothetical protein
LNASTLLLGEFANPGQLLGSRQPLLKPVV